MNLSNESMELEHRLLGWAGSDPADRNSHILLDELQVVVRVLREVLLPAHVGRVALPARQNLVLHFEFGDLVQVRGIVENGVSLSVVVHSDFDRLELIEDVELGDVDGVIAVDQRGVFNDGQIEPSASARTAGGGAELVALLPQPFAYRVFELGWERPLSHSGCVGLDNPNDCLDGFVRDTEPGAHATDSARGRSHVGVRAEVDVQQSRVGALRKHPLALLNSPVQPLDPVHDHSLLQKGVPQDSELVHLLSVHLAIVERRHPLELLHEGPPVLQVPHSQPEPVHLRGVCGSYAFFGRADVLALLVLDVLVDLEACDQVGPVGQEQPPSVVDLLLLQLLEFLEKVDNVDHSAVPYDVLGVRLQNPTGQQMESELVLPSVDRVACVVPAVEPGSDVVLAGEEIDQLPLALVAPLASQHDGESGLEPVQAPVYQRHLGILSILLRSLNAFTIYSRRLHPVS